MSVCITNTAGISHCTPRRHWALRLVDKVLALQDLRRQRHSLSRLNDALLDDIGVTRAEAEAEAALPVWDAPRHWRG